MHKGTLVRFAWCAAVTLHDGLNNFNKFSKIYESVKYHRGAKSRNIVQKSVKKSSNTEQVVKLKFSEVFKNGIERI